MNGTWRQLLSPALGVLLLVGPGALAQAGKQGRQPVAVDFDIGTDIDDAFALGMLLQSDLVEVKAVTTVYGDTRARARIAAKLLWVAGQRSVPVAAGTPSAGQPFAQAKWAADFNSPALVAEPAVELLHRTIAQGHDQVVLIALGPLSNLAALLSQYPQDKAHIKQIVLMGGSFARGYQPDSGPVAESNIAMDVAAAQSVFSSGVPLLVAPLDVTAALQMNGPERAELFAHHTALTDALRSLYVLWSQSTPTLHDPMAVALLLHPGISQTRPLHVEISHEGMTRVQSGGAPNATVALQTDPQAFIQYYESLFLSP